MRNYLFDRQAGGSPSQPPPPPLFVPRPIREKKRRQKRAFPAFLAFALVLGVLSGVLLFRQLSPGGQIAGKGDGGADFPSSQGGGQTQPGSGTVTASALPRYEGEGTASLVISAPGARPLTAGQIYDMALPSVVSIQAYSQNAASAGSGIILSADGYILTNWHIISDAGTAWVYTLSDGEGYEASLVGCAEELDLAVLKIDAQGLTPAQFGSSRDLAVGDQVYALGNPLGYLYGSLTDGIISALARSINVGGYTMSLLQTSAPLNEGSSGGALLNRYGQVVGVTSAKMTGMSEVPVEGLGLAIPISDVRGCVNSIIAHGRAITPRVGIYCRNAAVGVLEGVEVDSVDAGGPAERAGLLPGDFIYLANGIPVASVDELKDVFYDVGVGGDVALTLLRGGEELVLTVTLVE